MRLIVARRVDAGCESRLGWRTPPCSHEHDNLPIGAVLAFDVAGADDLPIGWEEIPELTVALNVWLETAPSSPPVSR